MKMMRLGNATEAALAYAKVWTCPTCAASSRPAPHKSASTRTRPFGFNVCVTMDLKYVKDSNRKTKVMLSMVDTGTGWHWAKFLKNRKPRHVARQIVNGWIAHYGVPEEIVIDQGGEFQGYMTEIFEQFGIDSRVTGARAGWQHGVAERHGGILGTIWNNIIYEHHVKSNAMADMALGAVLNAKNSTMTRQG